MKKIVFLTLTPFILIHAAISNNLDMESSFDYALEKPIKDGTQNSSEETYHNIDLDIKLNYIYNSKVKVSLFLDEETQEDTNASNLDIVADQLYLSYVDKTFNLQFGLQEITGPFFYQKNGDGLLFLKPIQSNILGFSYYINNSYSGTDEVYQIALVGEKGTINYELWYSKIDNSSTSSKNYGADVYQISVFNKMGEAKLGVMYTSLDPRTGSDRDLNQKQNQSVIYLENETRTIKYGFSYILTGDNGGNVALDQETDSKANYSLDEVGANDVVNGEAMYFKVERDLANNSIIKFEYFNGDGTTSAEEMRLYYKGVLDKNLYWYSHANVWKKNGQQQSEKITLGFNISF